jgi:hypothetical protein
VDGEKLVYHVGRAGVGPQTAPTFEVDPMFFEQFSR